MTNQPFLKSAIIWGLQLLTIIVLLFTFVGGKVYPELYTIENPIGPISGYTLICLCCVMWFAYINDVISEALIVIPFGFIFIAWFYTGIGFWSLLSSLLLTEPLINFGSTEQTIINPILIVALASTIGGMIGSWVRKTPIERFTWNLIFAFIGMGAGLLILHFISI